MSRRTITALLFYLLLAYALRATYGTYEPATLGILAAAWVVFCAAALTSGRRGGTTADASPARIFALLLCGSLCLLAIDPRLVTAGSSRLTLWLQMTLFVAAALAQLIYFAVGHNERHPKASGAKTTLIGLVGLTALVVLFARVTAILVTPTPGIDVFVTNTMASEYLLAGQNPYAGWYPDIYDGRFGYAAGYFYWPAYLYFAAPFHALLDDIRFASVGAEALSAVLVSLLLRRAGLPWQASAVAALVWFAHPVSLLVTELAWIDPVLILAAAGALTAIVYRRWGMAGVALGVTAAVKQYGALISLAALVYVVIRRRRAAPTVIVSTAATWLALVGPYLWLDWRAFYERTVAVYLSAPARADALSLPALLSNQFGVVLPGAVLAVVYLGVVATTLAWLIRRRRPTLSDLTAAGAVALGTIFLFGKQAFCNYYYLVAFFVFVHAALSMADDRRRSARRETKLPALAFTPQLARAKT